MAVLSQGITVGTTAVPLYHHAQTASIDVTVINNDASIDLLIGDVALTRTNYAHRVIKADGEQAFTMHYGETIYGITASGSTTITVHIFATGWSDAA